MAKKEKEIYTRALRLLKRPLLDIWSRLASEEDLDLKEIDKTKRIVKLLIKNVPNKKIEAKFRVLLVALRNPEKEGGFISKFINEFY